MYNVIASLELAGCLCASNSKVPNRTWNAVGCRHHINGKFHMGFLDSPSYSVALLYVLLCLNRNILSWFAYCFVRFTPDMTHPWAEKAFGLFSFGSRSWLSITPTDPIESWINRYNEAFCFSVLSNVKHVKRCVWNIWMIFQVKNNNLPRIQLAMPHQKVRRGSICLSSIHVLFDTLHRFVSKSRPLPCAPSKCHIMVT